jgi:hypothetical protein
MNIFDNSKITINLATLIDSRALLCANSGGGKSYALRKILEEAGSDVMSIIFDVEGEFKTLREKFDYLLIGQTGDVPINIKSAHLLPQKLMELNVSAIIDISELKMHERIMYVKKFLEALMELPRQYWKPCLIIVDEAHAFCGQREMQESTHGVIDLMTRGRKRGYCGILATQRIAKLHKDAAAEANNYMVGRTGLDVDMKRAAEILGFTSKEDMLSLRNLDAGEFYVFGTAISRGVEKVKVSKVQTTHPKVGMDLRSKITPPTAKIKSILSKLNDLPKEAEEKAKNLEDCKSKIRELEKQLRQLPAAKIDDKQIEDARQRGFNEAEKKYKPQLDDLFRKLLKISEIANIGTLKMPEIDTRTLPVAKCVIKAVHRSPVAINRTINADNVSVLNRCERSIYSLLYNNPVAYKKTMIGLLAGYSHKSGGFNNALSHLSSLGLIKRQGQMVVVSDNGQQMASELLGNDIFIHEQFTIQNWANKLPKCESAIFQFLMQHPDSEWSKEQLGEETGYQPGSGGFNNAISRLNSLCLIIRQNRSIKLNREILDK